MKKEIENPKECLKCSQKIGFKKLKSGKWIPVNADYINGKYFITINVGNHNNSTVYHKCNETRCEECEKKFITNNGYDKLCSEKCIKSKIKKIENGKIIGSNMIGDYRSYDEIKKDTLEYLNFGLSQIKLK